MITSTAGGSSALAATPAAEAAFLAASCLCRSFRRSLLESGGRASGLLLSIQGKFGEAGGSGVRHDCEIRKKKVRCIFIKIAKSKRFKSDRCEQLSGSLRAFVFGRRKEDWKGGLENG